MRRCSMRSGQVVQTLTQDAFHVYEDGVPQTIIASGMRTCRCRWGF